MTNTVALNQLSSRLEDVIRNYNTGKLKTQVLLDSTSSPLFHAFALLGPGLGAELCPGLRVEFILPAYLGLSPGPPSVSLKPSNNDNHVHNYS